MAGAKSATPKQLRGYVRPAALRVRSLQSFGRAATRNPCHIPHELSLSRSCQKLRAMATIEVSADVRATLNRLADRYTIMAAGCRNPVRVPMVREFATYDRGETSHSSTTSTCQIKRIVQARSAPCLSTTKSTASGVAVNLRAPHRPRISPVRQWRVDRLPGRSRHRPATVT
jgi:hypothetical protein